MTVLLAMLNTFAQTLPALIGAVAVAVPNVAVMALVVGLLFVVVGLLFVDVWLLLTLATALCG